MPAELERWSSETLWDENPPTLLTGFLVVSRETDHGRKGIDWKGIHLLVPLLGRLENQAFETGRTGGSSNIWSQPKSSRKSIHWDCPHCWTRGPCLARLPLPVTEHRHRPWKHNWLLLLLSPSVRMDPPIVPTSLHLSLLPDSKAGAGEPGLAWVPWTFGRQVSSIFHFNNERRLRHLAKTHKWGVSPNWKMDSNAGKPEKWKMSVIIAD